MNFDLDTMSEKNEGVSPVIGVILMVAIVVILAAVIGVFVLDLAGSNQKPAQASVTFDEDPDDGLTVRFTENVNADSILVKVNGSKKATLSNIGDSATVGVADGATVTVVGVNNGKKTVLQTYNATQKLGSVPSPTSGTVSYNPPAQGVTVTSYDANGNKIDSAVTGQDGSFTVNAVDDGTLKVNGYTVSNTALNNGDIELDTSEVVKNGDTVANVLMDKNGNGAYKINSASDLQAMRFDLDATYKLTSNIDASNTSSWNTITKITVEKGYSLNSGFDDELSPGETNTYNLAYTPVKEITKVTDNLGDSTNLSIVSSSDSSVTVKNNRSSETVYTIKVTYKLKQKTPTGFDGIGSSGYGDKFTGTLYGNNKSINNIYMKKYSDNVGIFAYTNGATIKNINIKNANINNISYKNATNTGILVASAEGNTVINNVMVSGSVKGKNRVGGIAGTNSGKIKNSKSKATVSLFNGGKDEQASVGGLVGTNYGSITKSYATGNVDGWYAVGGLVGENSSKIKNSYATSDVNGNKRVGGLVGSISYGGSISESYATGSVTASKRVGGLVGSINNGTISNSYTKSNVSGNEKVGGLVGVLGSDFDSGTISTSYATGSITNSDGGSTSSFGGLVGINKNSSSISDSYWNTTNSGFTAGVGTNNASVTNITGLTTSKMQGSSASSNMSALDFTNIWTTVSGDYPELQNNREQ